MKLGAHLEGSVGSLDVPDTLASSASPLHLASSLLSII
jgi:hypothetical protein